MGIKMEPKFQIKTGNRKNDPNKQTFKWPTPDSMYVKTWKSYGFHESRDIYLFIHCLFVRDNAHWSSQEGYFSSAVPGQMLKGI